MNLTAEDLKAIKAIIKEETDPINNRLDKIENRLETIEEDVEIIKGATEEILEWFDTYQRTDKDKPFPAKESDIQLRLKMSELQA